MIQDEQARRTALFFLFTLLDEKIALQAAHRAVAQLKTSFEAANDPVSFVKILRRVFESHRKLLARNRPIVLPETTWILPSGISPQAWTLFQRDSSDAETVVLVLNRILKISEADIARGLDVSVGTVHYRVGKAIRHLGAAIDKARTNV